MSNLTPAIEASGLTKAYTSSRQALAGVDLVVPRGTAFGLIGLNGAGKTTFVKALLGVVLPSAGQLRVLGGAPEEIAVRDPRVGAHDGRALTRSVGEFAGADRAVIRSVYGRTDD